MDIMSVSGMSGMLNTSKVNNDIQVAVLSKSLETYQTTGENLTKMMEASVNPNLGQNPGWELTDSNVNGDSSDLAE